MWAWAQRGCQPAAQRRRRSRAWAPRSARVSCSLVTWCSSDRPAYHVGMYIGNGMMVHAPTTGDVVKVSSLAYMSDYSGATRVG